MNSLQQLTYNPYKKSQIQKILQLILIKRLNNHTFASATIVLQAIRSGISCQNLMPEINSSIYLIMGGQWGNYSLTR